MSKYAYVVKGSEDGVIGVYSSKERAIIAGRNYYCAGNNCAPFYCDIEERGPDWIIVSGDSSWANAEIERFVMG